METLCFLLSLNHVTINGQSLVYGCAELSSLKFGTNVDGFGIGYSCLMLFLMDIQPNLQSLQFNSC